jgi:hypothetical protein
MNVEAMWYTGVKNPVPWYVRAAIIANIAITIEATSPTIAPPTIGRAIGALEVFAIVHLLGSRT